jgi:hypothetical protein
MSHIFISYSKTDIDFARYLRRLLEEQGFPVWMDEIGLTASDRWWRTIEQQIESSAAMIVIMSPAAAESDWVEREILLAEKRKRPLYPVLLAGEAWTRLANIQFESMTDGLRAALSPRLVAGLRRTITPRAASGRSMQVALVGGDVSQLEADVIVLKHSGDFRGADSFIAGKLVTEGGWRYKDMMAQPGEHHWIETRGVLKAPQALFIGALRPREFKYEQVSQLATDAVRLVGEELPTARQLAMTIHGVGFGLDEGEVFRAQINGYLRGLQLLTDESALEMILIVESNAGRLKRLEQLIDHSDWGSGISKGKRMELLLSDAATIPPAPLPTPKPYAFVAMPAGAGLDDLYEYGVMGAVHASGLLCTRLEDTTSNEGIEAAKAQIDSASVVIADVSNADTSVWLNVGYAWGKGRKTLLIARSGACPPFLQGVALVYERIKDLETALRGRLGEAWLAGG